MRYETSAFDKYPNERAMLRNAMADLRFASWEYLKAIGYELEKSEALEFIRQSKYDKSTPFAFLSISIQEKFISECLPESAKAEFYKSWHTIQNIHEQTRLIQKAAG